MMRPGPLLGPCHEAAVDQFMVVRPLHAMRFYSIAFLAFALVGCSRRSVDVSISNHSRKPVLMIYVCNGKSCQKVGSLAPGATVRVTESLTGASLSLTYWCDGHEREFPIPDARIHSGLASLTIGTNYLVEP